jgi:hypothetical protein
MAEWPFTDFFKRNVTALCRHGDCAQADLGPLESSLADGPEGVGNAHERENHEKQQDKNKFGSDQFAHEVKLEDEKRRNKGH